MKTVWVYTDTTRQVGAPIQLIVFADKDAADAWLKEFDRDGLAFEYPVYGREAAKGGK